MIACTKKTYKLELSNEVTANVNDLNKVTKNTLVILTIKEPVNGELDWLKVNDREVEVKDFKYKFKITKNTKVTIKITNDSNLGGILNVINILDNANFDFFRNESQVTLYSKESDGSEIKIITSVDKDDNLKETIRYVDNELDYYYNDSKFYSNNTIKNIKLNKQSTEVDEPSLFLLAIADFLVDIYELVKIEPGKSGAIIPKLNFSISDNKTLISIEMNSKEMIEILSHYEDTDELIESLDYEDFKGTINLEFNDNKDVISLNVLCIDNITNDLMFDAGIYNSNEAIEIPSDLEEYEIIEARLIDVYINNDVVVTLDATNKNNSNELYYLLKNVQDDLNFTNIVVGKVYLDQLLTTEINIDNIPLDVSKIYLGTKSVPNFKEELEKYNNDYILVNNYGSILFKKGNYEGLLDNNSQFIISVDNDKQYGGVIEDIEEFDILYEIKDYNNFLLPSKVISDALNDELYLRVKNTYIARKVSIDLSRNAISFNDEKVLESNFFQYLPLEEDKEELNQIIDLLINYYLNSAKDKEESMNVRDSYNHKVYDINDLSDLYLAVYFNSGSISSFTLEELTNKGYEVVLPLNEDDNLTINGIIVEDIQFYDSKKGPVVVYFDYSSWTNKIAYINDYNDFSFVNLNYYTKNITVQTSSGTDLKTFDDLLRYTKGKKISYIETTTYPYNLEDFLANAKKEELIIHMAYNNSYFDFSTNQYYFRDESSYIEITDSEAIIYMYEELVIVALNDLDIRSFALGNSWDYLEDALIFNKILKGEYTINHYETYYGYDGELIIEGESFEFRMESNYFHISGIVNSRIIEVSKGNGIKREVPEFELTIFNEELGNVYYASNDTVIRICVHTFIGYDVISITDDEGNEYNTYSFTLNESKTLYITYKKK